MGKLENLNLQRENYADKIVKIVEYRIISGELKPNEKISETSLAKEFDVSRGPAREALLRLEEMELVLKGHTGRVIKAFSKDEIRENYELKLIVEAYCCMQGAYEATERNVSQIRKTLEKTRSFVNSENHKKRLLLNAKFHELLVLSSKNNKLVGIYKAQVKKFGWAQSFRILKYTRSQKSYETHSEILDAFANKDGQKVRELTEIHQREVLETLLENI